LQQAQEKMLHFHNKDRQDKNYHIGEVIYEKNHEQKSSLILNINKEERYSRVPRLSDTRYSAIWRYASSKARLKCATYRRYTDLSVMGVRVGVANFFLDQSIGIDETNTFQLKFFI